MELQSVIQMRGSLRIILGDANGKPIKEWEVQNSVVTIGRAFVLGQLQTVNHITSRNIGFLAIGSGTTAPTTGDTALGLEVTRVAVGTFNTAGLAGPVPSWQAQVSFATSDANTTLAEAGLFNSSAGGTMLARATFASFVKATSNTLAINYTISG